MQNLLMSRYGGCAIPSGTYSNQVEKTAAALEETEDGDALELLPGMVERYAPCSTPDLT